MDGSAGKGRMEGGCGGTLTAAMPDELRWTTNERRLEFEVVRSTFGEVWNVVPALECILIYS